MVTFSLFESLKYSCRQADTFLEVMADHVPMNPSMMLPYENPALQQLSHHVGQHCQTEEHCDLNEVL